MSDTTHEIIRPSFVTEEHLQYLDDLRDSGATNMFGDRPFLQRAFKIKDSEKAGKILHYWMRTFSQLHPTT